MLISTTAGPDGRRHRAQVLLRLARLAAVWYGLLVLPPGVSSSGPGLVVAVSAGLASVGWLVMTTPPRRHPPLLITELAVQVTCGAVLAGITQSGRGWCCRQYMARVEQGDLLLAQAERARREQARAAALACSQARAAALEERTRVAREIHDVLAHSLTSPTHAGALAVQLDVTDALLDDGADNTVLRPHVGRARRLAVDGLTEARRAVTALREDTPPLPVMLDGLIANTGPTAEPRPGCRSPVSHGRCHRTPRWPRSVPPRKRSATPQTPHAAVTPDLAFQDDAATLTVTDTPPPSDQPATALVPAPLARTGGYGLTGLRERAELLGGTLRAGPDGTAWTVQLRLPVPP